MSRASCAVVAAWLAFVGGQSPANAQTRPQHGAIDGLVSTGQSTPLAGVNVVISDTSGRSVATLSTGADGRFRVSSLPPGPYRIVAALDGFDTATESIAVAGDEAAAIAIDLPIARFADTIDVVAEAAIVPGGRTLAPTEAVASRALDQFAPGLGFQGAVRLLSTVVPTRGGVSIKGGRPGQSGVQLGAATLVDPASGAARVALPDDAFDSVTVLPNPYAVEYGRFSSGLVVIQSRRAGDLWKFHANRVFPAIRSSSDGGLRIESFSPRFELGGPLVKDRLYFEQAVQARYNVGDTTTLSETEQRVTRTFSSFTRLDAAVSPRHSLTATMGVFPSSMDDATVGTFTPPAASADVRVSGQQAAITGRALWTDRTVSETTFQVYESRTDVEPQGALPMRLQPDTTLGNFFNRQHRATSSYQIVQTLTASREGAGGSHVIKVGIDVLHATYSGTSESRPVLVERADGTLARRIDFSGASAQTASGTEVAVFAQDRIQFRPRWHVEAGLRVDRDGVLGGANVSPRLGTAVLLNDAGTAVLRGGWGRFVERTPATAGAFTAFESSIDTRFEPDGSAAIAPGVRVVHAVAPGLETPVSQTWDVALDYRWSDRWAFQVGALSREGRRELIVAPVDVDSGLEKRLSSDGRSSYRDVHVGVHYTRGGAADVDVTYTGSRSRGDFNVLTNYYDAVLAPILADNVYAPLATDVPHRLLFRGRATPARNWLLLAVLDARTGAPYSVVNEMLDFVGPRNEWRMPHYVRLELGVERRTKISKFRPWIGVRLGNVLRAWLPEDVQNNTASPNFGAMYNSEQRRIRFSFRFER